MDRTTGTTLNDLEPNYTTRDEVRSVMVQSISWSAVFAGVAIAFAAQLLINMFGVSLGAASVNVAAGSTPQASTISTSAGIWWAIASILSAAAGGYAAGRLSGRQDSSTTAWHGLTSWAVSTLLLVYLVSTTVGSVMGGAVSALGSATGGLGQGAILAAGPGIAKVVDPFSAIEDQVKAKAGDPVASRTVAVAAMRDIVMGSTEKQEDARNRAAQALARAQNVPETEARAQIATYEQQYKQSMEAAKQAATVAADKTSGAVSKGMFWGMLALLLGALASWWAGREAAVSPSLRAVATRLGTSRRMDTR